MESKVGARLFPWLAALRQSFAASVGFFRPRRPSNIADLGAGVRWPALAPSQAETDARIRPDRVQPPIP
jgi:hypothetical protein